MGGLNIYHPPVADPTTGIMYASHTRNCSAPSFLVPTDGVDEERTAFAGKSEEAWRGRERHTPTTGTTVAAWKQGGPRTGRLPLIDGLPVYKPLYQGLAAYDMNTGEKLWDLPVGQTPARIRNHPLLKGVDVPNTGRHRPLHPDGVGDLLVQTTEDLRGETEVNANGKPLAARARQEDGADPRERRAPDSRPVRHDDLHARGQAVHPGAGRKRAARAAGRSGGAALP